MNVLPKDGTEFSMSTTSFPWSEKRGLAAFGDTLSRPDDECPLATSDTPEF
jgi:hypothetical protein